MRAQLTKVTRKVGSTSLSRVLSEGRLRFQFTGCICCIPWYQLEGTQLKSQKLYRPVYRVQGEEWRRLEHDITGMVLNDEDELILTFDYEFPSESARIEFAYTYPYSYKECQQDLSTLG